jgi:uncharacterized membrane-anchored protein
MIRIVLLILLIKLTVITALIIIPVNADSVTLTIGGYVIKTNAYLLIILNITVFFILHLLLLVTYKIISFPSTIKNFFTYQRHENNIESIKKLLIALKQYDIKSADRLLSTIRKNHIPAAIINILNIELAMLQKNDKAVNIATAELLQDDETKAIGLINLIKIEKKRKDWNLVINYAQDLWRFHQSEWLLQMHVKALAKLQNWHEVLLVINQSHIKSLLGKDKFARINAEAKAKLAMKLFTEHNYDKSLSLAEEARTYLMDNTDLVELLGQLYLQRGEYNKLVKLAHSVWPRLASAKLIACILKSASNFRKDKFFETAKWIADTNPTSYQSLLLLGKAALFAGKDDLAGEFISQALQVSNQAPQACLLMAEYCSRGNGAPGEIAAWVQKALDNAALA